MNRTTQKVVIIDNIASPYIDRAIIILRDHSPAIQTKVIADAEKIVHDYLEKIKKDDSDITIYNRPPKHSPNKRKASKLKHIGICAITALVALCVYLIFRV